MVESITLIDIFAGPGGLGEGFSQYRNKAGDRPFEVGLSVEKCDYAHETLQLRTFVRCFDGGDIPSEYYNYLRGQTTRDELWNAHPVEAAKARKVAWKATLGETPSEEVDQRVRDAIGTSDQWILLGGPPCQAFSLVGRSRMGGIKETDHRVNLYKEYLRMLAVHAPPVFVFENVKGLLTAKVDGELILETILADLSSPGGDRQVHYKLHSIVDGSVDSECPSKKDWKKFLVACEDYGIPQNRHRLIIVGVRDDIEKTPPLLKKMDEVCAGSVLTGLPRVRSGLSKKADTDDTWLTTIKQMVSNEFGTALYQLPLVSKKVRKIVNALTAPKAGRGARWLAYSTNIDFEKEWYLDNRIGGVCNHETKSHMDSDLFRYMFAACYAKLNGRSPSMSDYPEQFLPAHLNLKDRKKKSYFEDRFRVQLDSAPASTVTCHLAKDGHYFIHFDPSQCRSLTVREAARLQTFPDNYYFCGPRTKQYEQVGNAVPPLIAKQIAASIYSILSNAEIYNAPTQMEEAVSC